jgi:ketosteroid isomerase-like protein
MNSKIETVIKIFLLVIMAVEVNAQTDIEKIVKVANKFSSDFVYGNYSGMHDAYWEDAIILAPGRDILQGKEAIKNYWTFGPDFKQLYHKTISDSIVVTGDFAFDHGYWYAESKRGDNHGPLASGKYLVIWQKRNGVWKMHQDIWNNRSANWKPEKP